MVVCVPKSCASDCSRYSDDMESVDVELHSVAVADLAHPEARHQDRHRLISRERVWGHDGEDHGGSNLRRGDDDELRALAVRLHCYSFRRDPNDGAGVARAVETLEAVEV